MKFLVTYSKTSKQFKREPWFLTMKLNAYSAWQNMPWREKKAKLKLRLGYPFLVLEEQ